MDASKSVTPQPDLGPQLIPQTIPTVATSVAGGRTFQTGETSELPRPSFDAEASTDLPHSTLAPVNEDQAEKTNLVGQRHLEGEGAKPQTYFDQMAAAIEKNSYALFDVDLEQCDSESLKKLYLIAIKNKPEIADEIMMSAYGEPSFKKDLFIKITWLDLNNFHPESISKYIDFVRSSVETNIKTIDAFYRERLSKQFETWQEKMNRRDSFSPNKNQVDAFIELLETDDLSMIPLKEKIKERVFVDSPLSDEESEAQTYMKAVYKEPALALYADHFLDSGQIYQLIENKFITLEYLNPLLKQIDLFTEDQVLGLVKKHFTESMEYLPSKWLDKPSVAEYIQQKKNIGELFASMVSFSDGFIIIKEGASEKIKKFFKIVSTLPMEMQMVIAHQAFGSSKWNIPKEEFETAFKKLMSEFNARAAKRNKRRFF